MAVQALAQNTKITNKQPQIRNTLLTFSAAFMGVVIGVVAAFAVIMPMVRQEFADQSKQLSQKLVSMVPASATLSSCVQPSTTAATTSGAGQVLGASTVMPAVAHPGSQGPSTVFVSKLVSGVFATTTGTISDTGPNSTNKITTTNTSTTTVKNDNDVEINNVNVQSGQSGDATVKNNTTAGGATTGNTDNSNSSSDTININN